MAQVHQAAGRNAPSRQEHENGARSSRRKLFRQPRKILVLPARGLAAGRHESCGPSIEFAGAEQPDEFLVCIEQYLLTGPGAGRKKPEVRWRLLSTE